MWVGLLVAFEWQPVAGSVLIGLGLALIAFVWLSGLPFSVARYHHRLARIAGRLAATSVGPEADYRALHDELESIRRLAPPDSLATSHGGLTDCLGVRLEAINTPGALTAERVRKALSLRRQAASLESEIQAGAEHERDQPGTDAYTTAIRDHVTRFDGLDEVRYRNTVDRLAIVTHHLRQLSPPPERAELHRQLIAAYMTIVEVGSRSRERILADDELGAVAAADELSATESHLGDVAARLSRDGPKLTFRRLRLPARTKRPVDTERSGRG